MDREFVYFVCFIFAVFLSVMSFRLVKAVERIADIIEHYRLNREADKK